LDRGIELDSRYKSPVIYLKSDDGPEPAWEVKKYTPSTYPGSRVPHVFLRDGKRGIFDTFGPEWSLVTFVRSSDKYPDAIEESKSFLTVGVEMGIPIHDVALVDEGHAWAIWGYKFVLVRADGHVAWRGQNMPKSKDDVRGILRVVTGWDVCKGYVQGEMSSKLEILQQEYPERRTIVVGEKL
jgi:FAD-dependent monooxygenase